MTKKLIVFETIVFIIVSVFGLYKTVETIINLNTPTATAEEQEAEQEAEATAEAEQEAEATAEETEIFMNTIFLRFD